MLMDNETRKEFLGELCPRLRPVAARVLDCTWGCEALDFFRYRKRAWLDTADIAHYVGVPEDQAIDALNLLTEVRILQRQDIFGVAFFSMTQNEEVLKGLEQFWTWRDDWLGKLEKVRGALHLRTIQSGVLPGQAS